MSTTKPSEPEIDEDHLTHSQVEILKGLMAAAHATIEQDPEAFDDALYHALGEKRKVMPIWAREGDD